MATDSRGAAALKAIRERAGITVRALAESLGYRSSSSYAFYEDEYKKTYLPVDLIKRLVKVLPSHGIDEAEIWALSGVTAEQLGKAPTAIPGDIEHVPEFEGIAEIDVYGGLGSGGSATVEHYLIDGERSISADVVRDVWGLPPGYIAGELRVTSKRARIIEVRGDSMEPTLQSGDRVMIDVGDRGLSQEGIFALWDGDGIAVKRLERVRPSNPPAIRLISDNPRHRPVEMLAEQVTVIGRVIWVGRKM